MTRHTLQNKLLAVYFFYYVKPLKNL